MKFLLAACILSVTTVSGVALCGDGRSVDAAGNRLQPICTINHVPSANLEQKSAESEAICCACEVPMTYA